jgi:hypothetical protein
VTDVVFLPFGTHQGASLRVGAKASHSSELTGTSNWETLQTEFDVRAPEEVVELICELRASSGEARFDRDSLVLVRESQ